MISESFNADFDRWIADGKPDEKQLMIGTISEALYSIGIDIKPIEWDTSKINRIQREHLGMSDTVLLQIPNIIDQPIIVMDSKTQPNRVTLFGDVYNENNLPVMVILELLPTSRKNAILDIIKIANAYARDHNCVYSDITDTQNIINTSRILYIESIAKKTATWLSHNQLQLPLGISKYGSIDKVAYFHRDVNGNFSSGVDASTLPEWKAKLQKWDIIDNKCDSDKKT